MARKKTQRNEYVSQYSFHEKSYYSDYLKANREYFDSHPSTVVEDYNKKPKKPKRLAKWIRNVLVIASIVLLVVVTSTVSYTLVIGGSGYIANGAENVHNFLALAVNPEQDSAATIDLSGFSTAKEQAGYLYKIASEKATETPYFTAYNKGLLYLRMGSTDNYLDIDSVIMKTQNEYFSIVYHLKNSIPILDTFIGPAIEKSTDIITTERYYAAKGDSYVAYQKVKNNERDENDVPHANWDATIGINGPDVKKKDMIVFNSSQNGIYKITNHTINANTISDAEVTYNEEEGYYTVSVTLDHTNPETVANSKGDIIAGTGDSKAAYTYLKVDFTVWNTGYFRTFSMMEKWSAKVVISLGFELQTNWECSYAEQDCNLNAYHDAKIMKDALGRK